MGSLARFLLAKLKLKVNEEKSAIGRPCVISIIKSPAIASIKWSKIESLIGDTSGLNN
jgi:hypothetical protein